MNTYYQILRNAYIINNNPIIDLAFDTAESRQAIYDELMNSKIILAGEMIGDTVLRCTLTDAAIESFKTGNAPIMDSAELIANQNDISATEGLIPCRKCGEPIQSNLLYCPKCGSPLKRVCAKCGTELSETQEFCHNCGTKYTDGIRAIDIKNTSVNAKNKLKSNKKTVITVVISILLIIAAVIGFKILTKPNFNKMVDAVIKNNSEYTFVGDVLTKGLGSEGAAVKVGDDGKWIKIDTNPSNIDSDYRNSTYAGAYYVACQDLIEYINEQLGFSDQVFDDMLGTTALMGVQTAESPKATVKWKYHPDNGLEVTYTLKK